MPVKSLSDDRRLVRQNKADGVADGVRIEGTKKRAGEHRWRVATGGVDDLLALRGFEFAVEPRQARGQRRERIFIAATWEDYALKQLPQRHAGLAVERAVPPVKEVLLALNSTVEGQSTAHYVTQQLQGHGVTVTRLAQGVPVGGELDYLDEGTLAAAIKSRRPL